MLAAFAAVILAAAPARPAAPKLERASAEDCAVILAIGRAQLAWSATRPPAFAFFPELEQDGGGRYVESCPWKAMGAAPPTLGDQQSGNGFWISRPVYDRGRAGASADLTRSITPMDNQGEPMRGFLETRACTLEKRAGRWRLLDCRTVALS
jgi:hypothetical protein